MGQAARHTDAGGLVASPGAGHRSRAGWLAAQVEAEGLAAGPAAARLTAARPAAGLAAAGDTAPGLTAAGLAAAGLAAAGLAAAGGTAAGLTAALWAVIHLPGGVGASVRADRHGGGSHGSVGLE